jgi:hypothetical protein
LQELADESWGLDNVRVAIDEQLDQRFLSLTVGHDNRLGA